MSESQQSAQPTDQAKSTVAGGQPEAKKSLLEVTLSGAIALTRNGQNYDDANAQFSAIVAQVEQESPDAAKLLQQLWKEYVSVQRSASFYESLSDAEAGLSEKMAATNIQLKQNYMRLIQEQ